MQTFAALIAGLDTAGPSDWESLYAAHPVSIDQEALREALAARLDGHATVRLLREAVLRDDEAPPAVDDLPAGLDEWVLGESRAGHHEVARLGALLLFQRGGWEKEKAFLVVARGARAIDLPFLRASCCVDDLRPILDEVSELIGALPPPLHDAFVAALLPFHAHNAAAAFRVHRQVEHLRAAPVRPGGHVARFLNWLDTLPPPVADDPDDVAALRTAVAFVLERVDPRRVTPEELEDAVAAAPAVPDSLAVHDHLGDHQGLPAIIAGLLALRARRQTSPGAGDPTEHGLLRFTQHAIFRGLIRSLFPLRLRILEQLREVATDDGDYAGVLVQLANTRNALRMNRREQIEETLALLDEAMPLAERAGDAGWLADAVAMWARTVARLGLGPDPRWDEALRRVDRLLALGLGRGQRSQLLWAKAILIAPPAPSAHARRFEDAIALMREVLTLLEPGDPFRLDAMRELAHALANVRRPEEALSLAQQAMADAPADLPAVERAFLHHQLGECFQVLGRLDEAASHYREAGRLGEGTEAHALPRIRLAGVHLRQGRVDQAVSVCDRLVPMWEELTDDDRADLGQLRIVLADARGRGDHADAELARVLPVVVGTTREAEIRLAHAMAQHSVARFADAIAAYLDGAWLASAAADEIVLREGWNAAPRFPRAVRERLLDWAQARGDAGMTARLLDALGHAEDAVRVLRADLAQNRDPAGRLQNLGLLMGLLKDDLPAMRRAADEVEALLSEDPDPHGAFLADLATATRLSAGKDPARLQRARRHARSALAKAPDDAGVVASANATIGLSIVEQLTLTVPRSDVAAADLARELLSVPDADDRVRAAEILLYPGSLAHSAAFAAALELLGSVEASPPILARMDRCDALRARGEGAGWSYVRAQGVEAPAGPFDDVPDWLVELVSGRAGAPPAAALAKGLEALHFTAQARPDRMDHALTQLLPVGMALGARERRRFLDIAVDAVTGGAQHAEAWPTLHAALAQVVHGRTDPALHRLLRAARRARMQVGGEDPLERLAEMMEMPRDLPEQEQVLFRFERADLAMKALRLVPDSPEAPEWRALAEADLREARRRASSASRRWDCTVSLGNALRLQDPPRIAEALALYAEADRAPEAKDPEEAGKLHKVWADALRERGEPEDLREAWRHVEISLRHRVAGWRRTESACSAAEIALRHPDWGEATRQRRCAELYVDAVVADPKWSAQATPRVLRALADWSPAAGEAADCRALLDRLEAARPDLRDEIARARQGAFRGPRTKNVEDVGHALRSPDFRIVVQVMQRLLDRGALATMLERNELDPTETLAQAQPSATNLEELRALSEAITREHGERPGVLVARAHIQARMLRLGGVTRDALVAATEAARVAIRAMPDARMRGDLYSQLSLVWSSPHPQGDPFADMDRSAHLAEEGIASVGGEEAAHRDLLGDLARARRYQRGGDLSKNLQESRRLYRLILERDRRGRDGFCIAATLNNLADIEAQIGEGDRASRLASAITLQREAVELATAVGDRVLYTCNLAWMQTTWALVVSDARAVPALREALTSFDSVDRASLKAARGHTFENERTVCAAALLRKTGDAPGAVALWRKRLESLDRDRDRDQWALACHNLAAELIDQKGSANVEEGVALCGLALSVRTLAYDPRHHWETCLQAGRALTTMGRTDAREFLRKAIVAGRLLGRGQELLDAAVAMGMLALRGTSVQEIVEIAEEAWGALREAAPSLLLHRESAEQEGKLAVGIAFAITERMRVEGRHGSQGFLLKPAQAARVVPWLLRASAPYRRMVEGLLRPPAGLAQDAWLAWRDAVSRRDSTAMVRTLETIRERAPDWLTGDVTLDATWAWLAQVPGSVAVGVFPSLAHVVVVVLRGDTRRTDLLVLPAPRLGMTEDDLAARLRDRVEALRLLPVVSEAVRHAVVTPVVSLIGGRPERVLWSVQGALRLVPPSALWGATPVSVATSLALRPARPARVRAAGTTIFYADPEDCRPRLGDDGLASLRALMRAAGTCRVVASAGALSGSALVPGAVAHPASARQLVDELDHAATLVLLAHGRMESETEAWFSCVGPAGSEERLDVRGLGADPGAIAGLRAVLLSCETGRTGARYDHPGGLAGVLLACGAEEVVAPLWPVDLGAATAVGEAILRGAAERVSADKVLTCPLDPGAGTGRTLGRAPSVAAQQGAIAWDQLAFVRMVG